MTAEIYANLILSAFALMQAISVAVIAGLFRRESKKRKEANEKAETHAKNRAKESRLAMKLMSANTKLASATGIALKENRVNGEMDKALEAAEKAQTEYHEFINSVASDKLAAN